VSRLPLLAAVLLVVTTGCLAILQITDRYTCRSDGDCDSSQACGGTELVTDDRCGDKAEPGEPYYVAETEHKVCYVFYCAAKGETRCGGQTCTTGRTCVAHQDGESVKLACADLADLEQAASCSGFSDDACGDASCVRDLVLERDAPDDDDLSYRCLTL